MRRSYTYAPPADEMLEESGLKRTVSQQQDTDQEQAIK